MNPSHEIGAAIKKLRLKKKLSQKQLSSKIYGVESNDATISRIENGNWENTNFITIVNIFNALDVNLIKLIKTL